MRLSRRQRSFWYIWRYDQLIMEGFSPEEAALIANTKISAPEVRRLRRKRKRLFQKYIYDYEDAGYSIMEAREEAYNEMLTILDEKEEQIIDWDTFKRILYAKKFDSV